MAHHHRVKLGYDLCAQIIIKSAQDNLSLVGFLGSEDTLNHIKSNWVMTWPVLRETCLDESPQAGCGRGVATASPHCCYMHFESSSPLSSYFESPSLSINQAIGSVLKTRGSVSSEQAQPPLSTFGKSAPPLNITSSSSQ